MGASDSHGAGAEERGLKRRKEGVSKNDYIQGQVV